MENNRSTPIPQELYTDCNDFLPQNFKINQNLLNLHLSMYTNHRWYNSITLTRNQRGVWFLVSSDRQRLV